MKQDKKPAWLRAPLLVVGGLSLCLIVLFTIFGGELYERVDRMVGLSPVLNRLSGPVIHRTTSDRKIELLIRADRWDTKRTDRWRLKVPASFVSASFPEGKRDESAIYYLDLLVGSDESPAAFVERERREGRPPAPSSLVPDMILIKIGTAMLRDPAELDVERFERLEKSCVRGAVTNGLVQYDHPPEGTRSSYCSLPGRSVTKFAAGSEPGRYEILITCHHPTPGPGAAGMKLRTRCEFDRLSLHGWGLSISRFDMEYLPKWRELLMQVIDFLDAHTVESTTRLQGSNLGWIRARP